MITKGRLSLTFSRVLQTFFSSLGRRLLSRVSNSVLSIPDAGDSLESCDVMHTSPSRGRWGVFDLWEKLDQHCYESACDCCSSLWSKNCSFSVNFEIVISLQPPFPIMLVSLTNMASFVFWMPELTSPHHHSKQIRRRQHLGTKRSVPSCPVVCHWILTCGPPHTTSAPPLHGPLFPRWFGNAPLERRETPCHQFPWLLTNQVRVQETIRN